uniref:FAD-binding domain-containing protein n=1 Tax=Ciona savignyi TaxID=51511 RepID=H2ZD70_CIOSA
MERVKWEYEQSAVVATLKSSEATNNIVAWQRFLPSGPIALLPLDNNTCSLVWSTSHDHAEKLCKLPPQDFVYEVNNAFWQEYPQSNSIETLKELTQNFLDILSPEHSSTSAMQYPPTINSVEGAPLKFPLGLSHSNQYVRSRVAFIGDAVHRIHPLAGQGVNLGFRDVQGLLKVIENAKYNGQDAGSLSVLLGYESSRQLGNLPIVMAVDVLKRLYSSDFEPLVALRTIGSTIFNKLDPIKRRVIEQAGL